MPRHTRDIGSADTITHQQRSGQRYYHSTGISFSEAETSARRVEGLEAKPKVYALSTCPYCKRTKRFLDSHNIAYDVVDVDLLEGDEQERVLAEVERLTGRRSFPVVVVGSEIIVGHDEEKLKRAFKV